MKYGLYDKEQIKKLEQIKNNLNNKKYIENIIKTIDINQYKYKIDNNLIIFDKYKLFKDIEEILDKKLFISQKEENNNNLSIS